MLKIAFTHLPLIVLSAFLFLIAAGSGSADATGKTTCAPTQPDALGPFYKPDAPVRATVGKGYELKGTVRSSQDCSTLSGAKIEFWLAGTDGRYDDNHRATVFSGKTGTYRFESNFPPPYAGRPSHIHIRVTAKGFRTLVTQHYPVAGTPAGEFDLVLVPLQ